MKNIIKIKLKNFKRFRTFEIEFDPELNIIIGDNESGKSTIITALNLVISGSLNRLESIGLESLFCSDAIKEFMESDRNYNRLPELFIEIYLNEQHDYRLNGRINSDGRICDGLKLNCIPNDELSTEIREILSQDDIVFPFEYYSCRFTTFSGEGYTGNKRYLKQILIDNSQISSEYAIREYVKDMYNNYAQAIEKNKNQNEYRKLKDHYTKNVLSSLNERLDNFTFSLRNSPKSNLETDLTLCENEINIENQGKGRQCYIKTQFALTRHAEHSDIILIEEPENHLSHINMKRMIREIRESTQRQIFIATHSNMISTRLDLRKSILLNSSSYTPILLRNLTEPTAKFFIKAPDNNVLDFILSKKVILVEGDSEYILMDAFFYNLTGSTLEEFNIHTLSVDGTSFKRYLEIATFLNIKTAVIRDNDHDHEENCISNFEEYLGNSNIRICYDVNNERYTFEVCLYQDNKEICDHLFAASRRTLTVQEYMIKNKTNAAFELLQGYSDELIIPSYIQEAFEWLRG